MMAVTFISPWSERVSEIATAAVVNIETEQRVVRLNEELKDMARELRSKDQSLQERSVKIELMDKRMETAKKQADQVIELEEELNKSRKDTKTFEQTIEELQKELEGLEKENVKLKGAAANAPAAPADAKPGMLPPCLPHGLADQRRVQPLCFLSHQALVRVLQRRLWHSLAHSRQLSCCRTSNTCDHRYTSCDKRTLSSRLKTSCPSSLPCRSCLTPRPPHPCHHHRHQRLSIVNRPKPRERYGRTLCMWPARQRWST